jgi:predicted dehydrogenase
MDRPLRIAVIGIGFGQQVHVPAFRADERCQVAVLGASSLARAAEVAARLGVPEASGDWQAVVHRADLDAVSIAVPPDLQSQIAATALECGKAAFCEKPLAATVEQAEEACRAAERSGLANVVNFEFPECDAWRCAREWLDRGAIGSVSSIDVDWRVQTYGNRARLAGWKSLPERGGGALNAFAAHTLYALELFGGRIAAVRARLGRAPDDDRPGETEVDVELRFTSGAGGRVHIATDAPPPHYHRFDLAGAGGSLRLINEGRDYLSGFRVLHASPASPKMTPVTSAGDADHAETDGRVVATARLVRKFVDSIAGEPPAAPTFADGRRVQVLIAAARQSSAERRWVDTRV